MHGLATIDDAIAIFCVGDRKAAWHKLGQRTPEAVTWQQAMKLAKLDWQVGKRDLYVRQPVTNAVFQVPDQKGIFRLNDGAYLGVVGKDYEPIQNEQAFDFVDSILQAENGAHYESAGALGNGEKIWALARIPDADIRIKGTDDFSLGYLMVATSHDGSMSYISKLTSTRIVCQNTLNMALNEKSANVLKVKHTKDAKNRLAAARQLISNVTVTAKTLESALNTLATRKMTKASMTAVLDRLFPATLEADTGDKTKVRSTKASNVALKVLELFESNDGDKIPQIRGTAYNLLNACTEYADHFRTVRITESRTGMTPEMARAEGAIFGTGNAFKTEAMTAVLELTQDAPTTGTPISNISSDKNFLASLGIAG